MAKRNQRRRRRPPVESSELPEQLKHVNLNAAGIDVGAEQHFVALPPGRAKESVKEPPSGRPSRFVSCAATSVNAPCS